MKPTEEQYHDVDGTPVSLDKLCRTEPEWAANVIRQLKGKLVAFEAVRAQGLGRRRSRHRGRAPRRTGEGMKRYTIEITDTSMGVGAAPALRAIESETHGDWVRAEDALDRIAEIEAQLATALQQCAKVADAESLARSLASHYRRYAHDAEHILPVTQQDQKDAAFARDVAADFEQVVEKLRAALASAAPASAEPSNPMPRVAEAMASRFIAGDSIAELVDDYGHTALQVEAAIRTHGCRPVEGEASPDPKTCPRCGGDVQNPGHDKLCFECEERVADALAALGEQGSGAEFTATQQSGLVATLDAMAVSRAAADLDAVSNLADELAEKGTEFAVANQSWRANVYSEIAAKLRGILGHLAVYPVGQCK